MQLTSSSHTNDRALVCIGTHSPDPLVLHLAKDVIQAMNLDPVLFHVTSPGTPKEEGDRLLLQAREFLDMERTEVLSRTGRVFSLINHEAARRGYRLIVLGTSSRDEKLPISPLTRRLANCLDTSILILRNPPDEMGKILICTGGHMVSVNTVSVGIRIAQGTGSQATILHVASGAPAMYTGLPAIEEDLSHVLSRDLPLSNHLKEAAALAEQAGVEARLELRHGLVVEEILRACDVYPHDLVVIGGQQPHPIIDRMTLGRVSPKLLASTKRSTLIVR